MITTRSTSQGQYGVTTRVGLTHANEQGHPIVSSKYSLEVCNNSSIAFSESDKSNMEGPGRMQNERGDQLKDLHWQSVAAPQTILTINLRPSPRQGTMTTKTVRNLILDIANQGLQCK